MKHLSCCSDNLVKYLNPDIAILLLWVLVLTISVTIESNAGRSNSAHITTGNNILVSGYEKINLASFNLGIK